MSITVNSTNVKNLKYWNTLLSAMNTAMNEINAASLLTDKGTYLRH